MKTENLEYLNIHKMTEEQFQREKEAGNIKENEIYLTPYDATERQALIAEVIDSLRVEQPETYVIYGDVDDNNNIVIKGTLQDGTYLLKYEDAEGQTTNIGQLVIDSNAPKYTNWILEAGFKENTRLKTDGTETAASGMYCTGFIPCNLGDTFYLKDIVTVAQDSNIGWYKINIYDANKNSMGIAQINSDYQSTGIINDTNKNSGYVEVNNEGNLTKFIFTLIDSDGIGVPIYSGTLDKPVKYVRFSTSTITSNSIITVNEPIV